MFTIEHIKKDSEAKRGQGWLSGECTCLPPVWPGFESWRHMWVEIVVGSLHCSERFFSGTPVFPSPQKPAFPNSNLTRNRVDEEPPSGSTTSKSLFTLFKKYIKFYISLRGIKRCKMHNLLSGVNYHKNA